MNERTRKQPADVEFTARLKVVVAPYRDTKRLTWLAAEIERTEGALRSWLKGESMPNATDIRNLCAVTGTNTTWLVDGVGEQARSVGNNSQHMYSRELIIKVARAMEEELAASNVYPAPAKRADLLIAFLYLFKPYDGVADEQREAIRMMIKATN